MCNIEKGILQWNETKYCFSYNFDEIVIKEIIIIKIIYFQEEVIKEIKEPSFS